LLAALVQRLLLLLLPTALAGCLPPCRPAEAGRRKLGRHYNPWSAEVQQQLATVLRLALR